MYLYNEYMEQIRQLSQKNSSFIKISGETKTADGRNLVSVKVGNGIVRLIIIAGIHGREWVNTKALYNIIKFYCKLYSNKVVIKYDMGIDIKKVLDARSILFIPLANPDGYAIATQGFDVINNNDLRRKCISMGVDSSYWKYNARGVDINRNFMCKSYRKKNKSDYPFSENETIWLKSIFDKYRADILIDVHSRGENIYYYRNYMNREYNKNQLRWAQIISDITGYRLSAKDEEIEANDSGGNTVHYYSEYIKNAAITIETVCEKEDIPIREKYIKEVTDKLMWLPLKVLNYSDL